MERRSASSRQLTQQELQRQARQIGNAVAAIHAAGYLHNDIQPGNILLTRDSANDISAALNGLRRCSKRIIEEENKSQHEVKSVEVVLSSHINELSYLYQAPEVILSQGEDISVASDVWSLGVLFYTLSCGRLPFAGIHEIINQPLSWSYALDLMQIRLSEQYKELISSMLDKEPSNRPSLDTILSNGWFRARGSE